MPAPKEKFSEENWPAANVALAEIKSLTPYARNARTHSDAQVAQIAASIREWGWTAPVLIDEHRTIIAGHGRVLAAEKLGLSKVPVMVAKGWSDAQVRAYVLADNRLAENAGWDEELLEIELNDLKGMEFDVQLCGFEFEGAEERPAPGEEIPGNNYKEQYAVIVTCTDEMDQERIYNQLMEMGFKCKVVST